MSSRRSAATWWSTTVPGASGTIGHASVARARPDGYTLLLGVNSTYAMARHLFPQRGYDDEKSFAGIGRVATTPIFLCVSNKLGVSDIKGFVARAKKDAGKLSYASSGAGSSAHLATELFLRSADIDVLNVTYRGGAPAVQALISGEVQMAFVDAVTALPLIAAKQVTAIGVSSPQRNPLAPEIPTIAESGYPGYECSSDFTLLAPAGTPPAIIQKLAAAKAADAAERRRSSRSCATARSSRMSARPRPGRSRSSPRARSGAKSSSPAASPWNSRIAARPDRA